MRMKSAKDEDFYIQKNFELNNISKKKKAAK
jgi:hypothetical protein